jgi:hypothetical protein
MMVPSANILSLIVQPELREHSCCPVRPSFVCLEGLENQRKIPAAPTIHPKDDRHRLYSKETSQPPDRDFAFITHHNAAVWSSTVERKREERVVLERRN